MTNILIIYTGGTIGMIQSSNHEGLVPFNVENIIENVPELKQIDCKISVKSFDEPIDSSDFGPKHYNALLEIIEKNYYSFDGFVILHGTDTMSYTASALSFKIENQTKPIIFTGSQLPIGHIRTDAKENLITSVLIASMQNGTVPVIQEVCLYFEFNLYRANRTTKVSAEQFNAYISPNFPKLGESGVNLKLEERLLLKGNLNLPTKFNKKQCEDVAVLKIFPGMSPNYVEAILNIKNLKGVILETFGAGNTITKKWFLDLIKKAVDKKLVILNVSQCSYGEVVQGKYKTSLELRELGVISGKDMTFESAITKLMFLLANHDEKKTFLNEFSRPLSGEITIF